MASSLTPTLVRKMSRWINLILVYLLLGAVMSMLARVLLPIIGLGAVALLALVTVPGSPQTAPAPNSEASRIDARIKTLEREADDLVRAINHGLGDRVADRIVLLTTLLSAHNWEARLDGLYPTGHLLAGTLVITAFVFSDTVDGIMARASGRSSSWGASSSAPVTARTSCSTAWKWRSCAA